MSPFCAIYRSLEGLFMIILCHLLWEGRRLGLHLFLTIFDSHPPPPSFIFLVSFLRRLYPPRRVPEERHLRHFEILGSSPLRDLLASCIRETSS